MSSRLHPVSVHSCCRCGTQLEEQGETPKRHSPMDPFTCMCNYRTTSLNLSTTALKEIFVEMKLYHIRPVFISLKENCSIFSTSSTAITQECWEQYWTSPGGNTPQDTNYTATSFPSHKLYKLDKPDTQDTAGEARTNSSVMYSYGPPHMAKQKQDDQLEHTYSSYVKIRDVALKTCQKRWMIGRGGERGSGISVLVARHDDDDI